MAKQLTQCLDLPHLNRLLENQVDDRDESGVLEHLGSCEKCQRALEKLAGPEQVRAEIQEHLIDYPTGSLDDLSDDDLFHDRTRDLKQIKALLGPTDDPEMLGRLKGYSVRGIIGRGSAGIVVKALDERLNRYVAIKILAPLYSSNGCSRRRFEREGRSIAAVRDAHVIPIYAVDEFQGSPYIVMQYMPGGSLHQRIEKQGPLSTCEVARIGMQIAHGLAAAHRQGIVHRDVKPANVLLENGVDRALVTDFGLARVVDEATMTRSGSISGTPQYMSPEQAKGISIDQRSDLFSLGSVMYAACTGHSPFRSETVFGVIKSVCDTEPQPIRDSNSDISEWLVAFVTKLHAKSPDDRFESAAQVAELLAQELAHLQSPTMIGRPERKWYPVKPRRFNPFGGFAKAWPSPSNGQDFGNAPTRDLRLEKKSTKARPVTRISLMLAAAIAVVALMVGGWGSGWGTSPDHANLSPKTKTGTNQEADVTVESPPNELFGGQNGIRRFVKHELFGKGVPRPDEFEIASAPLQDSFHRAYELHIEGQLDKAIEAYEVALDFGVNKHLAAYNLGCVWVQKGEMDKAFAALDKSVSLGFHDLEQLKSDAELNSIRKDHRFKEILVRAEIEETVCSVCDEIENENFVKAEKLCRQALAKDPKHELATFRLGFVLHSQGKIDEAIEWHKRSMHSDHYSGLANYNLGCVYSLKNDSDKAFEFLNRALDADLVHSIDVDFIQSDTELDNIRTDKRYPEFIGRVKKTSRRPQLIIQHNVTSQSHDAPQEVLDEVIELAKEHSLYAAKINWSKVATKMRLQLGNGTTSKEVIAPVQYLLGALGDHHGALLVGRRRFMAKINGKSIVRHRKKGFEMDVDLVSKIAQRSMASDTPVNAKMLSDRIAYIEIPSINAGPSEIDKRAIKIRKAINTLLEKKPAGVIIDLRTNLGGNMHPMFAGLGRLFPNVPMGGQTRDGKNLDLSWSLRKGNVYLDDQATTTLPPINETGFAELRVAVLTGRYTCSSGEAVASGLNGQAGVKLFGEHTSGFTTSNCGYPLADGTVFSIAVGYYMSENKSVHFDGVTPQVEIEEPLDLANLTSGKTVNSAIDWIKSD